jgi:hypothetical protein
LSSGSHSLASGSRLGGVTRFQSHIPPDFYRPGVTRGPVIDTAGFAEARAVLTVGRALGHGPMNVEYQLVGSGSEDGPFVLCDVPPARAGVDIPRGVAWTWLPLDVAGPGMRFLRAEVNVIGTGLVALAVSLELSRGEVLEDDSTVD